VTNWHATLSRGRGGESGYKKVGSRFLKNKAHFSPSLRPRWNRCFFTLIALLLASSQHQPPLPPSGAPAAPRSFVPAVHRIDCSRRSLRRDSERKESFLLDRRRRWPPLLHPFPGSTGLLPRPRRSRPCPCVPTPPRAPRSSAVSSGRPRPGPSPRGAASPWS